MARILGVDYGRRRLGFSVSDPDGMVATPRAVRRVDSRRRALAAVIEEADGAQAEKIILGHPLNMDGSAGELAREVETFREDLMKRVNVPVELWDERMTSRSAEQVLLEAGARRGKRKEVIDKLAAQIMLQSYLDAQAMNAGRDGAME